VSEIDTGQARDNDLLQAPPEPVNIRPVLGLDLAVLDRDAAVSLLEHRIRERKPVRLAFVNANLANMAHEDARLRASLGHFLLFNDGAGIKLASLLLHGQPFPSNLNGTDFTPYFLDRCRTPLNVFLLGARPQVLAKVEALFTARWPRHCLVGCQHGYFGAAEEGRVCDAIRNARPDIVLVGMGNGIQEQWVERLVPGCALSAWGVGALFDFLAGEFRRAPLWMRRCGIEWVYRLMLEPRRMWRRYLIGNPKFLLRVLNERRVRSLP
jgi:exopolysaccharide biosynthesis WecB/TagA/CpsF family protein